MGRLAPSEDTSIEIDTQEAVKYRKINSPTDVWNVIGTDNGSQHRRQAHREDAQHHILT
jgi:hypothetical protein